MISWVSAGPRLPPSQLSLGHWELEYICKHNTYRWQHRLEILKHWRRAYIGVPPYPRVIFSKTYRSYVKLWITLNAIYNTIFV
jgi:hypothetical protein